ARIERNCELLPVVIVCNSETAAEDAFTVLTENEGSDAALKVWRPGDGNSRLEVIRVRIVHWRGVIFLAGPFDYDRLIVVPALSCSVQTPIEVLIQCNIRGSFETVRLVHRRRISVAKSKCQREARSHLPGILNVKIVLFGCEFTLR